MKTILAKIPFFIALVFIVGICSLFIYNNAERIMRSSPIARSSIQPVNEVPARKLAIEKIGPIMATVTSLPRVLFYPQTSLPDLPSQTPAVSMKPSGMWNVVDRENNNIGSLQYYCGDNVEIGNGRIVITSRHEKKGQKEYTSGMLESAECFLYGSFRFKIHTSSGVGLFPAIWMLPANDKPFPEIDIFEMIGRKPNDFYGVLHYIDSGKQTREYFCEKVTAKEFYLVDIEWAENELKWSIDGKCLMTVRKGVPQEYMYLIINQAVGGEWAGVPDKNTVFPATFIIDSYDIRPELRKTR